MQALISTILGLLLRLFLWVFKLIGAGRTPAPSPPPAAAGTGSTAAPPPAAAPTAPSDDWTECSEWILQREGGLVDNPDDPGGITNMGITIPTLTRWLGRPATPDDIRTLPMLTALAIYRQNYWDANSIDKMPRGVNLLMLDCVVMSGPSKPNSWLQCAVATQPDGVIGPVTLAALSRVPPRDVINKVSDARLAYYKSLTAWEAFGNGWRRRVEDTRARALTMLPAV